MPAMTNILVKDDATTPVEVTLEPVTDNPMPQWRSSIAGVPLEGQMRMSMTQELLKSGSYRFVIKTEVPVMETLGASGTSSGYVAPPKVAYVNTAIFTMFADKRATIADRANLLKIAIGILQGASVTTNSGTLANNSAGDAWKNSTLPGPLSMTKAVLPN